jgi:aspartyl-tRNA(Asn)/glutamyl-tRNA(Gln) amidotransferase subunit C
MEIDNKTVGKIATLAKLQFDKAGTEQIKADLNRMLDFVDKINEVDTDNVEPLVHMNTEINVLREDIVEETITQQQALKNAPQKDSDYFKIPKVLNK